MVKPRREVAKAISESKAWPVVFAAGSADTIASAVLARLVALGAFNLEFLRAIQAEAK